MSVKQLLVLGTHNRKKGRELYELLGPCGFELRTLADYANVAVKAEEGDSFAANAAVKATTYACLLHQWVLGEDSGLSVDALQGAPGVHSARYAGINANDNANNARLLAELSDTPLENRTAHYVCHVAVSDPRGELRARSEERCHGRIRHKPAGQFGFGYDPLFEIVEYHRTFGELGLAVKSALSHRSRAVRALLPQLLALAGGGQWT